MTAKVKDIVSALSSGNYIALQESVKEVMSEKVLAALEEQKQKIAKSYFGKK